jgi:hypothetical protein
MSDDDSLLLSGRLVLCQRSASRRHRRKMCSLRRMLNQHSKDERVFFDSYFCTAAPRLPFSLSFFAFFFAAREMATLLPVHLPVNNAVIRLPFSLSSLDFVSLYNRTQSNLISISFYFLSVMVQ